MSKKELQGVTEAAKTAGQQLAMWGAVEAAARKAMESVEAQAEGPRNFAEIHFVNGRAEGVVKVGDFVMKVSG